MINPLKEIQEVFVVINNKPGVVGAMTRVLTKKRIAIYAIGVFGDIARLYVSRPEQAVADLNENGYEAEMRVVLRVDLPNRVGALMDLTCKLGNAGINIEYLYGAVEQRQKRGVIILDVDKPQLALDIFATHRF